MDKRKMRSLLSISIALIAVFLIFKMDILRDIWNNIVRFNLEMSQEKVIWVFLIFWVEIFIILIFWDLFIYKISVKVSLLFARIEKILLKTKKIRLSIFCIRLDYGISKLMYFLRLGWWRYGVSDDNEIVWNNINRYPIKNIVLGIFFSIIKLPALIALFLTAMSMEWFDLNDIQDKWMTFRNVEFAFWEFAKMLSPLTGVVLLVFIWYFVSFRGSIKRTIAQANRKKMEDIIQKQRELVEAIGGSIYLIASNLQYVINCQELIADLWIHSRFPNYEDEKRRLRDLNAENYCFKDIPELEVISQMFDELNSNGNLSASRAFSSYKYEFLTLMSRSSLLNSKRLNETFFTKEGMKTLIIDNGQLQIKYSVEEIQRMRKNYLEGIPERIVDGLQLLYKLCRYYAEMNKLLNFKSDKVGRTLRMFTGKE